MKRGLCIVLFLFTALPSISAQPAAAPNSRDDRQKTGLQLFVQHCGVCHNKPSIVAEPFGPVLSRDSLGGEDAALRQVIGNGTPRMPGFRYQFAPAQIDAIIAYMKSVPPQPAASGATPH